MVPALPNETWIFTNVQCLIPFRCTKVGVNTYVLCLHLLFQICPPISTIYSCSMVSSSRGVSLSPCCVPSVSPWNILYNRVTWWQTILSELWHCPSGFCLCPAEAFDLLSALSCANLSFCASLMLYCEFLLKFSKTEKNDYLFILYFSNKYRTSISNKLS